MKIKKEKIYNTLLYILILCNVLSIILLNPLNNLDEIWNYNFARNIKNGLVPYKDFNMVITPFLSIVCGIILKITTDELIVMRFLAAILCSSIIYVTYKILCLLEVKKNISIICIFFMGYLFKDIYCIDYNYACLLVALTIIYNEIKLYRQQNTIFYVDVKKDIWLGLLAGISITLKQTTGLFISLALLGNKLLFVRKKENFRVYLKSTILRLLGIIIPILIFMIYLIINSAFAEFVNYAIKGISEFTNKISYKSLINWNLLGILSILVPIVFIYSWIKTIILEKSKEIYFLMIYGLSTMVICFPISDKIHFLIGAFPIIIIILYEIYNLFYKLRIVLEKKEKLKIVNKIIEFIIWFFMYIVILFLIFNCIFNFNKYIKSKDDFSTLKHFKYISIDNQLEIEIKNIDKFILENKNVIIADTSASLYMIPIDRYNKDFDTFNKGNFGANGEKRLIEQISNSKDVKYLLLSDKFSKNWQMPTEVIEFIKLRKNKIGTIEIYDIYE